MSVTGGDEGWAKEFPQVDGAYYVRLIGDDADSTLVRIENRIVHEFGVAVNFGQGDYKDCEWLGPITPSHTAQLVRLREAAELAVKVVEVERDNLCSYCRKGRYELHVGRGAHVYRRDGDRFDGQLLGCRAAHLHATIAVLRAALAGEGE